MARIKSLIFGAFLLFQSVYSDRIDDGRLYLEMLIEEATMQGQNAFIQFETMSKEINELAQQVYITGPKQIMQEQVIVMDEFQNLEHEANVAGVNDSICIKPQLNVLQEVYNFATLALDSCVLDNENGATVVINKAIGQINVVIDDVVKLARELDGCKSTDAVCVDRVLAEVSRQQVDTPRKLHEAINFTANRVEVNTLRLRECGAVQARTYLKNGVVLVDRARSCLKELIEHKPTGKPF